MKKQKNPPADSTKIKVLVVDDHPILREGLEQRLGHETDMLVCGGAEDTPGALAAIQRDRPDVVIVDISLRDAHGLELIKDLKAQHPDLPVLVFSMHDEVLYAERALHAGARGYVMKQSRPAVLVDAIRRVHRGEVHLSPEMTRKLLGRIAATERAAPPRPALERLSDREYEVFELIGQGYDTQEIAARLRLSPKTVASHRENLKHKFGFHNSAALLRYAIHAVDRSAGK